MLLSSVAKYSLGEKLVLERVLWMCGVCVCVCVCAIVRLCDCVNMCVSDFDWIVKTTDFSIYFFNSL